jgi:hypothetical protein
MDEACRWQALDDGPSGAMDEVLFFTKPYTPYPIFYKVSILVFLVLLGSRFI